LNRQGNKISSRKQEGKGAARGLSQKENVGGLLRYMTISFVGGVLVGRREVWESKIKNVAAK